MQVLSYENYDGIHKRWMPLRVRTPPWAEVSLKAFQTVDFHIFFVATSKGCVYEPKLLVVGFYRVTRGVGWGTV